MSSSLETIENPEKSIDKDASIYEESLSNIYKDALKYAPSKIVGAIVNLAMVSVFTNLLLPKEYGLYMVSTGVISFLAIIFSDWVGISALRFFREHFKKDNVEQYFSTILFLLFTNLLIMYLLGFFLYKPMEEFFKIPSKFLFMVFILLIPIAIRALLFQVLRAQIKPLAYTFFTIINQILSVGIAVFLVKQFNLGAMGLLAGMSFSIVIIDFIMLLQTRYTRMSLISRKLAKPDFPEITAPTSHTDFTKKNFFQDFFFGSVYHKLIDHEKVKFEILSNIYKYGCPVAFASIGMWLITQSNRFILQYFKGSYFNGQLGVGFNLTFSIMMPLFAIISMAAIPRLINKYEDGKDVRLVFSKLTKIYFLIFMPLTFVLCIYPKETVLIFSNSKFADAYILIPFLALSAFFLGLAEITTIQYYLVKKTWIDMSIRIFSGIAGIILNILLIPISPLLGVGIAALISNFLYLLLSLNIKIKDLNWEIPYGSILKSVIVLAFCFCISILLRNILLPSNLFSYLIHVLAILGVYAVLIRKYGK